MSKPRVFITLNPVPQSAVDLLKERFDVELCKSTEVTRKELLEKAPGVFAIFCSPSVKIDEELIKIAGPSLKVVGTISVGYDHVNLAAMKKYGIRLGYTPDVLTEAVAETTVGLLISTTRRFFEANHALKTGQWKNGTLWMCGMGIKNSVVGIVGCGNIGTSIAKKLSTFQISQLLYTSRSEKPAAKALGGKLVSVDELVEKSDFIILSVALNEDTKFIINKERIAKMKSNAVLVNIGRGGLVDQDALIEALQEKRIGAAGLDVMTPEPLPLDNPLMKMDNVEYFGNFFILYRLYPIHVDGPRRAGLNTFAGRSWPAGRTLPITGLDHKLFAHLYVYSIITTHWKCCHSNANRNG